MVLGFSNHVLLLHVEMKISSQSLIEDENWFLKQQVLEQNLPKPKNYTFFKYIYIFFLN